MVAEVAPDKEGVRKRSYCEGSKRPQQSGSQQRLVSVFDIFYPHFPPTSNSSFIVFIPGLLRYKTKIQTIRKRGSGGQRLGAGCRDGDMRG